MTNGTIKTLLNGDHTFQQLADGTPAQLSELLTPRWYALMRHPTGGLATAQIVRWFSRLAH